jgi:hypothetical protein
MRRLEHQEPIPRYGLRNQLDAARVSSEERRSWRWSWLLLTILSHTCEAFWMGKKQFSVGSVGGNGFARFEGPFACGWTCNAYVVVAVRTWAIQQSTGETGGVPPENCLASCGCEVRLMALGRTGSNGTAGLGFLAASVYLGGCVCSCRRARRCWRVGRHDRWMVVGVCCLIL